MNEKKRREKKRRVMGEGRGCRERRRYDYILLWYYSGTCFVVSCLGIRTVVPSRSSSSSSSSSSFVITVVEYRAFTLSLRKVLPTRVQTTFYVGRQLTTFNNYMVQVQ